MSLTTEGKESGTELMDTRFQIITDLVSKGDVVLNKILKTIEPTDVMTQAIDGEDFHACYDLLNIVRRTTQLQVTPLSILYAVGAWKYGEETYIPGGDVENQLT
jgi:hypothetical protein